MAKRPDVIVTMGGDISELKKAVKRSEAVVRGFSDRLTRLGETAGRLGAAGAIGGLSSGLVNVIGSTIEEIALLEDATEALNLTVETFGSLEVAVQKVSEITRDDLIDILKTLTEKIGEANREAGTAREQFQALGLDWIALSEIPVDMALLAVADALNEQTNQAVKASIANDLFEDKWLSLAPAINAGVDALSEYRREAEKSPIITDEAAESIDSFKTDMKDLGKFFETEWTRIIAKAAEGYKDLRKGAAEASDRGLKEIRREIVELQTQLPESQNAFTKFLESINVLTPKTGDELGKIRDRIKELRKELEKARDDEKAQTLTSTPVNVPGIGVVPGRRELSADPDKVENIRDRIAQREKDRKLEGLSDTRRQVLAEGELWAAFHTELSALQDGQTDIARKAQEKQVQALNDLFESGASKEKLNQLLSDIGEADLPKPKVLMDVQLSPDAFADLPQKLQDSLISGNYVIDLQVSPSLAVGEGIDGTALGMESLTHQVGGN